MSRRLRRVEPPEKAGAIARGYARIAGTKPVRVISRRIGWRLDPLLLRATGGRVATTAMFASEVLETTGARSGRRRRNAVLYFHDGDDVIIAASNAGAASHPAWFHNLVADPDVAFAGSPVRAAVVDDPAELSRLWPAADRVFPLFRTYRDEAASHGRTIPLIRLSGR